MQSMRKNTSGSNVSDLQRRLKLLGYNLGSTGVDGIFGQQTEDAVKKFQQDRALLASGVVDQETWNEVVDAGYKIGDRLLYLKNPPFRGDDVRTLQLWLKILGFYPYNENGIFCERTHGALLEFQSNMNIGDDGIMGKRTVENLMRLQRIIKARKTSDFPYIKDANKKYSSIKSSIVLDYNPGHGGIGNPDLKSGASFINERIYICRNITGFCREILSGYGYEVRTTFNEDESQGVFLFDRISNANNSGSDYLVSINLNYSSDPGANGSSCYYFRGLKSYSVAGLSLAGAIQDNLVSGLGLLDCRVHGAGYAILKNTEMVSVLVEPAFISNKEQRRQLQKTGYQKKLSEKISEAIKIYIED
jgi:N-acetylmuramoyl-L-alanine amidase